MSSTLMRFNAIPVRSEKPHFPRGADVHAASRRWHLRIPCASLFAAALLLCAPAALFSQELDYVSGVTGVPAVQLASTPLYASGSRAKPTLTLALSVEFPTVGAQYLDAAAPASSTVDSSYSPSNTYIGYFDAGSCYVYNNHGDPDYRRFDRIGSGSGTHGHACGGTGFSGNFMNWATSSAIDVLRLALTGGDRIVDEANLTVLQRAMLPTGQGGFWNGNNFPAKQLRAEFAAGAVPSALRGSHTGDIFVANCFDRVHFGTESTGSCSNPGNNANLGVLTGTAMSSTSFASESLSHWTALGFEQCANEGGTCSFSGIKRVVYGANDRWHSFYALNGVACTNAVIGDPINGTPKACYFAQTDGGWMPPGWGAAGVLTDDRFFYARVRVCEGSGASTTDPRGSAFCQRYPSGYFKPVGNLQKYSDRVRVSAFGYLMDQTSERYGGVLRAPMRFVGERHFDNTGANKSGVNPFMEWDAATGVFHRDPDGAATATVAALKSSHSGVINYLNKFGRTGSTTIYKTIDPVAELYYEALRYVQGLQPTSQAYTGWTEDMRQDFPFYTQWTDPHADMPSNQDYSCVRNNILTIGDQNTHYDKSIPGNTTLLNDGIEFFRPANPSGNEPNFVTYSNKVGELDPAFAGTDQNLGQRHYPQGATNPGYFMAGMAYWANTHDIRGEGWSNASAQRPGMRVTTYVLDVNENGSQGNAGRRHASPYFLAAKYGGFIDNAGDGDPHTAGNAWEKSGQAGEARTYYLASSAQDVLDGINEIFASVAFEASTIAGGAVSSTELSSTDTGIIYRGQFDATDWSGDLVATGLSAAGEGAGSTIAVGERVWSADEQLQSMDPAQRKIFVGRPQGDTPSTVTANEFIWSGTNAIGSDLQDALRDGADEETGQERLAWLRGDRSKEGEGLRTRTHLMGDIINSGVAFSGPPGLGIVDADYYTSDLYKGLQNRPNVVFVGTNGGMLHAINAGDDAQDADGGKELFAFIPSWVAPRLHHLTDPNYAINKHQSFVDATPVVGQARIVAATAASWKTVLVSGTGAGGRGVFALNVSDPANFGADDVLWEFTSDDDSDLGYVVGKPHIVKIKVSTSTAGDAYKWYAVVAGGVNNYVKKDVDATDFSETGRPALFFLDLSKPKGAAWAEGENYHKVLLRIAEGTGKASGLLNFTPMLDIAGAAQRIYAGDLHGHLWRFDLDLAVKMPNAAAGPGATIEHSTLQQRLAWIGTGLSNGSLRPLFVAGHTTTATTGSTFTRQPITAPPMLYRADARFVAVAFGTGQYLEEADNLPDSSTNAYAVQSFYVMVDSANPTDLVATAGLSGATPVIQKSPHLRQGTNTAGVITVGTTAAPFTWATLEQLAANLASTTPRTDLYLGWYFDFGDGERQVGQGVILGGNVLFNTLTPPLAAQGVCSVGTGNSYVSNIVSGVTEQEPSSVGLLAPPIVVDPGEEEVTAFNSVGQRTRTTYPRAIQSGTEGIASGAQIVHTMTLGRLSWREISNYGQLHHEATAD